MADEMQTVETKKVVKTTKKKKKVTIEGGGETDSRHNSVDQGSDVSFAIQQTDLLAILSNKLCRLLIGFSHLSIAKHKRFSR